MVVFDHEDQQKCIFSNFIVMYSHVFTGLEYLHSKKIIHGDVKGCIIVRIIFNNECVYDK